ncbi:helix-turn-helix domain-containing protein [Actinokineospora sp. 24-640]
MGTAMSDAGSPAFYSVREVARILGIDQSTLYRAIREGGFPAVRVRSRYLIPSAVLDKLIAEAAECGGVVDPSQMTLERRAAREAARLSGGAW